MDQKIIENIISYRKSDTVAELKNSLDDKSILEILGVGRLEIPHSNFLAWLFNPNESHGLGLYAVEKLLLILASRNEYSAEERESMPLALKYLIIAGSLNIRNVNVQTEVLVPDINILKGKGRVDIVIDIFIDPIQEIMPLSKSSENENYTCLRIVLENKVFSSENGKKGTQTETYYNYFEKDRMFHHPNYHCVFTYLTPINRSRCSDLHFIHITYQDIFDNILYPMSKMSNITTQTAFIIQEYIKNLSITTDSKNLTPMAMEKEQRELLVKFWNENSELITASIDALSETEDNGISNPEILEQVAKGLKELRNNTRHTFKFTFDYKGKQYPTPLGQGKLVLNIIKEYVADNPNCTYSDLQKVFAPQLQGSYGCFTTLAVAKDKEKTDKPRYFADDKDQIKLADSDVIVVCSQWGTLDDENGNPTKGNFPRFKKAAIKLGFDIQQIV